MDRLSALQNKTYDLAIVGGGIVGAGIARDAALRGLSVALFEKGDYCSGTTAKSTRLIHGGLRYLETLDFRLVRLDLKERETLLRIAGHLVKPLPFIVPFYRRNALYRGKVLLGMALYDLLGFDKSLPSHSHLSLSQISSMEPLLERRGLHGGFIYYDAQVASPERLVIENIVDAREHGADAFNYCEVTSIIRGEGIVRGVRVRDLLCSSETEIAGKIVVNAGGPWFDRVSGLTGEHTGRRVRTTKGIHIVCDPLSRNALVLSSGLDDRLFFVVPWLGQTLAGTTDTDFYEDPGAASSRPEEVEYLLKSIRPYIPSLDRSQIRYSYAGVRALVPEEGSPSAVSRMHRVVDEAKNGIPGLISVMGGKITGYRAIAEEVMDLACAALEIDRPCRTAATPLPGSRAEENKRESAANDGIAGHLLSLYGSRAIEIIEMARSDERLRAPLASGYPDIVAQVLYSVRHEQCVHAIDFLLRRTLMGFSPDQGCAALDAVICLMAAELNWSEARMREEREAHIQWVRNSRSSL